MSSASHPPTTPPPPPPNPHLARFSGHNFPLGRFPYWRLGLSRHSRVRPSGPVIGASTIIRPRVVWPAQTAIGTPTPPPFPPPEETCSAAVLEQAAIWEGGKRKNSSRLQRHAVVALTGEGWDGSEPALCFCIRFNTEVSNSNLACSAILFGPQNTAKSLLELELYCITHNTKTEKSQNNLPVFWCDSQDLMITEGYFLTSLVYYCWNLNLKAANQKLAYLHVFFQFFIGNIIWHLCKVKLLCQVLLGPYLGWSETCLELI